MCPIAQLTVLRQIKNVYPSPDGAGTSLRVCLCLMVPVLFLHRTEESIIHPRLFMSGQSFIIEMYNTAMQCATEA